MGARGPKSTPTKVLEMRGSWRGAARSDEPEPEPGKPPCPSWLSKEAKAIWKKVARQLEDMRVLAKMDSNVLARYCTVFVQWRDCARTIASKGPTYNVYGKMEDPKGKPVVVEVKDRPEVTRSMRLGEHLNRLEAKLGLSPADRVGLKTVMPTVKGAVSKGKDQFFAGGKQAGTA